MQNEGNDIMYASTPLFEPEARPKHALLYMIGLTHARKSCRVVCHSLSIFSAQQPVPGLMGNASFVHGKKKKRQRAAREVELYTSIPACGI